MARATPELIRVLRDTAARIRDGARFQWTHMGACILGNMAQTVTSLSAEEIHRLALQKAGDWGEQARTYCPQSGFPMDHIIGTLVDLGLTREDIDQLERLTGRLVLKRFPSSERLLDRRNPEDVVRYLEAWADMLEEELPALAVVAA